MAGREAQGRATKKNAEKGRAKPGETPPSSASPGGGDFPIVCVGASAGGLRAIEGFFAGVPQDCEMAFVVVQHLDPQRESLLKNLIGQYADLPVRLAEEGTAVEPGHIYVKAPGRDVVLRGGTLHLQDSAEPSSLRHPINAFLRSLADDKGERGIAVILSGTGSDGTLGVRAVHAAGGLVLVQEEGEAEYDGMPRSAIETGMVDFVLPAERMAQEIMRYCNHPLVARREMKREWAEERSGSEMATVLGIVRAQTGHDFSLYKRNTIRRRIERRLAIHKLERLSDYAALLRQNPSEGQALFKDLLINVTSFFRDPEAFELLGEELRRLLKEHPAEEPVRVWVPGCATGEEAYTLAILLIEAMEELEKIFPVKIFASDINPQSIETGREGIYPDSIAADVSGRRLMRYFTRHEGHYRVDVRLREMVVFAVHDLTRDPPFSRLDLVCCRNLLIYLETRMQKKVIPLLRYALKPGGVLLLGSSEEVGEFGDLFTPLNRKWKIFRALEQTPVLRHQDFNLMPQIRSGTAAAAETPQAAQKPSPQTVRRREAALRALVETSLMEEYAPPGVLLDEHDDVLYFHGETSPYLSPPRGEPSLNVARLVRGEVAAALPDLLSRARALQQRVRSEALRMPTAVGSVRVEVSVKPMPTAGHGHLLVTFETVEAAPTEGESPRGDSCDVRLVGLQRELFSTRQDLQATIEELETANEELQSANEELQANNEELQSTNEELETSREELQSTNEEIETVNAELKKTNDELLQANDDINNLFTATDIGTLILDTSLRIKRYTPSATRFFRLIPSDVGRPVTDIATTLIQGGLGDDLRDVLESLHCKEREIESRNGRWYAVHIVPYRTSTNVIAGVIVTFTDITDLKKAEIAAREARLYADAIIGTLREPFLVLDAGLKVVSANGAFYNVFRVERSETENSLLFELGAGQWDIAPLRELLERIVPANETFDDFRVEHDFPHIGRRVFLLNARRIERKERADLILLAFEDVTQRQGENA